MKVEPDISDSELLQSMLTGDEEALAVLYRRWQHSVFRFALQMCGSRAAAEDVTQEVFIVLIREGHNFDPARGSLNAFLIGVARNHVLRRLRRDRVYVLEENLENEVKENRPLPTSDGPLDELARTERVESVRKAVLALPEKYREAVVLCDLEEMSYVEAAGILGCAVGTVRSRLHRGRALLLEKLRPAAAEEMASATAKPARCFA